MSHVKDVASSHGLDNPVFHKEDARGSTDGHDGNVKTARSRAASVQFTKASIVLGIRESDASQAEPDDDVDLSCGIWKIRTNIFGSWFSNLYVFSVLIGLSTFFTMMINSTLHVHLTSIERQFNIDNSKAGLFDTVSKIGNMCTVLLAGHFAKKVHIPIVVGVSGIIQGIALMLPAFMQLRDPYTLDVIVAAHNTSNGTDYGDNGNYLCHASQNLGGGNHTSVNSTKHTDHLAFTVILIVQGVKGVTDAFHSGFLPSLYMDDNIVDKTKMGVLFGINSILSELSQPIGKEINGILSDIPIDLKETEMDTKDRRFVAAWWLAFLAFGAGTTLFSIPVMLFPRKLVSKRKQEAALALAMVSFTTGEAGTEQDLEDSKTDHSEQSFKKGLHPTISAAGQFRKHSLAPRISQQSGHLDITNPISRRMSSLLPPVDGPTERRISIDGKLMFEQPIKQNKTTDSGESVQGSTSFKDLILDFPRAFVRVFQRPVFFLIIVDILIVAIPMTGTAMFRSVYITNEYNVKMSEVATLQAITQAVAQILGTFLSGLLASRVKTKSGYNYIICATYLASMVITPMYIIFGCSNDVIYGHQGDFGQSVNSSLDCGCTGTKQLISCGNDGNNYLSPCYAACTSVKGKVFTECLGLNSNNHNVSLTPGECPSDCHSNFLLYVLLHAVQSVLMSMGNIPRRLLILRMVDPRDRGFATSMFGFCFTFVGIISPNLFGKVIDNTCLIWDGNYCSLYDRDQIRYLLSGLDIGTNVCVQITMILIIFIFRKEERDMKKKLNKEDKTTADGKVHKG